MIATWGSSFKIFSDQHGLHRGFPQQLWVKMKRANNCKKNNGWNLWPWRQGWEGGHSSSQHRFNQLRRFPGILSHLLNLPLWVSYLHHLHWRKTQVCSTALQNIVRSCSLAHTQFVFWWRLLSSLFLLSIIIIIAIILIVTTITKVISKIINLSSTSFCKHWHRMHL